MKRTYKIVIILVLLAAALAAMVIHAARSTPYRSHYNAVAFVHSNTSSGGHMSFSKFDGTNVFKLKCKDSGGSLIYSASLEEGSAVVSYDNGGGKTELFTLRGGEHTEGSIPLEPGTVYVIVETDGACREGSLKFEIGS